MRHAIHPADERGGDDVTIGGQPQEGYQMMFELQIWFPLLTIVLTAAICLSVVSFIMGHAKLHA